MIALSDAGLELQFDLPSDATAEDRARVWQYPARVVQRPDGSMELMNGPELDERVDQWLTRADLTREMCGRWVFTWNAFRIECDPSSVIADLKAINLLSVDLRDGAVYEYPGALGSAPLSRRADGKGGSTYTVKLDADADAVRRSRAEGDVAVGEIMQQPVTLETALSNRSAEAVSGTVEITFNVDPSGRPIRRVVTTTLETEEPGNVTKTETRTVTVERKPV